MTTKTPPSGDDAVPTPHSEGSPPEVPQGSKRWVLPDSIIGAQILLLAIVLVPLLLVRVSLHYAAYHERRSQEFRASLELARGVAAAFEASTQDLVRQQLAIGLALASSPPMIGEGANQFLAANAQQHPGVRSLSWVSPQGVVLASSLAEAVGENVGDGAYWREVAQGREWAVSDLLPGQTSEDATFALASGVRDQQGALQGIVVAMLSPHGIGTGAFLTQQTVARAISIRDSQGWLVHCQPEKDLAWAERDVAAAEPAVLRCLAGAEATDTAVSALDGRVHMAAFAPISSLGWVVSAGRPEAEVMAPVFEGVLIDLGLWLGVALASLGLAIVMGRSITIPIGRLQDYAVALGRGEYRQRVVPAGPDEVRELAMALNTMAQEMRTRDDFREDYAYAVSHDLRQPLTLIYGQAQMLKQELQRGDAGSRSLRSVEAILTGSMRMNAMIQDLVDAVRLEAGLVRLKPRAVDLRSYILDLRARLAGPIDPGLLDLEAPAGLPPALADLERLERILMNLLSNAFKYSPPNTPVSVSLGQEGDEIVVSIADRGPGIPPEEQPYVFERFYRAKAGESVEGLGLGLYITRLLVQAHRGRIWLESAAGKGSTFKFTLPIAQGLLV